ncbi:hypothetical protein dsx2_0214 [Desulfovibrio sp. X2]|uniref:tetratricopeptide repeat protein n=1 Tax=Desulfovibrio sp. X2 TaxID=941449 RepID=UPI000358D7D7|nr:tetratricopeptide repeat protein [Desulfovibrio sp. X2]EPR42287.1 hypothetical protein dsx2_0214 [Desulfovibrio sp. X2]
MANLSRRIVPLVLAAALACPSLSSAATPTAKGGDFATWLEQHGAYDALDIELSEKPQTPEVILERARLLLKLSRSEAALGLLKGAAGFSSPSLEHERLWLLGQAARQSGRLPEALAAWLTAIGPAPTRDDTARLREQPGFPEAYEDVCRIWLWEKEQTADPDIAAASSARIKAALDVGRATWPADLFWLEADQVTRLKSGSALTDAQASHGLRVTDQDRETLVRTLAHAALGDWRGARLELDGLSQSLFKDYWNIFLGSLQSGVGVPDLSAFRSAGMLKAAAFWDGIATASGSLDAAFWKIHAPSLRDWNSVRTRLDLATPAQAKEILDKELGSSQVDPLTAERLQQFGLAFALLGQETARVSALAKELAPSRLPLSLKLALSISRRESPRGFFKDDDTAGFGLLRHLTEAAGFAAYGDTGIPFWTELTPAGCLDASARHPFDQCLLLAALTDSWDGSPSPALARRLGLLFPGSRAGAAALVSLAADAGKAGEISTSAAYLGRVNPALLSGKARVDWLQAKGALEIELGRDDQALATYTELYTTDRSRLSAPQRIKLALLAEARNKLDFSRVVLEDLWKDKNSLTTAEQAETLFWLAEVADGQGRTDEALHDYLQVAWSYPQENIWELTALYRAAQIYERTDRLDLARELLGMVIKNSDRKSQRDQAEQLLQQIDARSKAEKARPAPGSTGAAGTGWTYPF